MALDLEKMHTSHSKGERIPEGTFMSRIGSLVDMGVQPQTHWKTGEKTESKPRLLLTWELPDEKIEVEHNDGSIEELPRLISKEYTASNYEMANIVKLAKEMLGGSKNLVELLDMPSMISIGSTNTGNAKVVSCVKAPKGMEVSPLSRPPVYFDFDAPEQERFESLAGWVQDKIRGAENYNGFADTWGNVNDTEEAA